jgi:hypothetical protein
MLDVTRLRQSVRYSANVHTCKRELFFILKCLFKICRLAFVLFHHEILVCLHAKDHPHSLKIFPRVSLQATLYSMNDLRTTVPFVKVPKGTL